MVPWTRTQSSTLKIEVNFMSTQAGLDSIVLPLQASASQHLLSGDGSLCLVVLFNQESVQMSLPGWVVLRFNFFFTDRSCSSIIISLLTFHQEVYCGGRKLIWDLSVEYGICNLDASFSPWNSWLESRTKLSFGWIN